MVYICVNLDDLILKIGINAFGKHENMAMNENEFLSGRPHGGSVIIWNQNVKAKKLILLSIILIECVQLLLKC